MHPTDEYNSQRGYKRYELSNHLGNVLAVVSDMVNGHDNGGTADYYAAMVISASDYYPYGWVISDRKYVDASGGHRYGFNGQEQDAEWRGGQAVSFRFRIHDPRLGKFLSVDPLAPEYPWYTPYQFAGNEVIMAAELEGLEAAKKIFQNGELVIYDQSQSNQLITMHSLDKASNSWTSQTINFTQSETTITATRIIKSTTTTSSINSPTVAKASFEPPSSMPQTGNEYIDNLKSTISFPNYVVRKHDIKVSNPLEFGFSLSDANNPNSNGVGMARHALEIENGPYISASSRKNAIGFPIGAETMGGKRYWIDVDRAAVNGSKIITNDELITEVFKYMPPDPISDNQSWKWFRNQTTKGIEQEILFDNPIVREAVDDAPRMATRYLGAGFKAYGTYQTVASLYNAGQTSFRNNSFRPILAEGIRQGGSWAGSHYGQKLGALSGNIFGILGGSVAGGIVGYELSDKIADKIYKD